MDPVPFEIVIDGDTKVASNGAIRIVAIEPEAVVKRRRGVAGLTTRPAGDVLLPQVNQFAGDLLKNPTMSPGEAVARLMAIAGLLPNAEPRRIEWAVVELNGVRVYADGLHVIVTTKELYPQ